jgi:ABC-type sugar transport system permease subunit
MFNSYALVGALMIAGVAVLVMMFVRGNVSLASAMAVVVLAIVLIIGLAVFARIIGNMAQGGMNII